jgi:hypothetical protein
MVMKFDARFRSHKKTLCYRCLAPASRRRYKLIAIYFP